MTKGTVAPARFRTKFLPSMRSNNLTDFLNPTLDFEVNIMTTLRIDDLNHSNELDASAMAETRGGAFGSLDGIVGSGPGGSWTSTPPSTTVSTTPTECSTTKVSIVCF